MNRLSFARALALVACLWMTLAPMAQARWVMTRTCNGDTCSYDYYWVDDPPALAQRVQQRRQARQARCVPSRTASHGSTGGSAYRSRPSTSYGSSGSGGVVRANDGSEARYGANGVLYQTKAAPAPVYDALPAPPVEEPPAVSKSLSAACPIVQPLAIDSVPIVQPRLADSRVLPAAPIVQIASR